jgi:renalase
MKIAIIGAGLAGSALAKMLKDSGHQVTVLEKSGGRGGRMATKRLSWGHADMGAQYFTARDPDFISEVEDWCKAGFATPWQFSPHVLSDMKLVDSPDDERRYVGVPDMNFVAKSLLIDTNVVLKTKVTRISKDNEKWYLWQETNSNNSNELIGVYDWIVSTLPAEQASEL